ncbi:hypothetical protein ATCC90586_002193 [Pythium insidiosum]|nr:hypothetical protein ATCC90586_002193 [Pythium insidiosum]
MQRRVIPRRHRAPLQRPVARKPAASPRRRHCIDMTPGPALRLGLLQSALTTEDRVDDSNWLSGTLIDVALWRLATQHPHVHFLPTDFCHLHLPSVLRRASGSRQLTASDFELWDVLGRPVDFADARPMIFVVNVGLIHWNLLRVQLHPTAELQLFEPMGRLASRRGISYRSVPRSVIQWLDACFPQQQSWLRRTVSAITTQQQLSGVDCGVACLLYADKCAQGQHHEEINATVDQPAISSFRRRLQSELREVLAKHVYSDRFIPSRLSTKLDREFELHPEDSADIRGGGNNQEVAAHSNNSSSNSSPTNTPSSQEVSSGSAKHCTNGSAGYSMLLKSELLGIDPPGHGLPSDYYQYMDDYYDPYSPPTARGMLSGAAAFDFSRYFGSAPSSSTATHRFSGLPRTRVLRGASGSQNILHFKAQREPTELRPSIPFSSLPCASQRMLAATHAPTRRKIPKTPFKVLDAPALQDDFYLNLIDWSATNVLAVGLGSVVYLWSACTSKVTKLCDLGPSDSVASVAWSQRGTLLSVGTNSGDIQLWDTAAGKRVRTMPGHLARVGTAAWSAQLLASGSRDRTILLRDVRAAEAFQHKLAGHKQEVCGLKWSFDDQQLASGGNDNKLFVWSVHAAASGLSSSSPGSGSVPVVRFSDHTAAVKAIAWSPHQNGLLASGGGTADRCIRFWNTHTNSALHSVDTGSQVCNLMWSKNVNEVVSTHGYSLNQIIVWKYPTMAKLATLTGHTFRVLYLAMSPDGQTIVTGAGDETLRFWNAFPSSRCKNTGRLGTSLLLPLGASNEIR